jgi:nucleoside-diphosphate-sugar epimerase
MEIVRGGIPSTTTGRRQLRTDPARDSAMRRLWMDIGRAREELSYEPLYCVDRAIAEYADWLRAHPE